MPIFGFILIKADNSGSPASRIVYFFSNWESILIITFSQAFSIKNSNDLIGWFLQWREKKLSPNLGDVKVAEISFETFEGWMVNWMLGTKIIWMTCDVKIYAKQNNIHSSSNFQNSTFQYPDHEKILRFHFNIFCFVLNFEFWREGKIVPLSPKWNKIFKKRHFLLNKYRNDRIFIPETD